MKRNQQDRSRTYYHSQQQGTTENPLLSTSSSNQNQNHQTTTNLASPLIMSAFDENRPIHNLSTMDDDGIVTPQMQMQQSPSTTIPIPNANNTSMIDEQQLQQQQRRSSDSSSAAAADPREGDPYYFMPKRDFSSIAECEQYVIDWNQSRSRDPTAPFIKNPFGSSIRPCGDPFPMYPKYTCCSHGILFPLIIGPIAIFCTSSVPSGEWWSRAIAIALGLLDLFLLHAGSMVDPGVVLPLRVGDDPPADGQLVEIDGIGQVKLDVCRSCKILRPPRSSHCGYSKYCVTSYDHACGVTSHIVTESGTLKFFVNFMYVTSVLILFVAIRSIHTASQWNTSEMTKTSLGTWYLVSTSLNIAFIGLALCWVAGVGCHYTDLVCSGHTLKDRRGRRRQFADHEGEGWSCATWCKTLYMPYHRKSMLAAGMEWQEQTDSYR